MKQLLLAIFAFFTLVGCAEIFEIADILIEDEVIHTGTVSKVEVSKDGSIIHFEDGYSYHTDNNMYVPIGNEVKIVQDEDGNLFVK